MCGIPAEYKVLGVERKQQGNHSYYALSDLFRAKDGWIFIVIFTDRIFKRLVKLMGRMDLIDNPEFQGDHARYEKRDILDPLIQQWVAERTLDELSQLLEEGGVPYSRIFSIPEMVEDPHIKARGMLDEVEQPGVGKIPVVGSVIKLSKTPAKIQMRSPTMGENNEEIYCGLLGYSRNQLALLEKGNVI